MRSEFDYSSYNERECSIHNHAFYLGEQHQQSKIDELQKRVDAAIYLLPSIKAENDLWGCDQVERQIELLEQALKGGLDD